MDFWTAQKKARRRTALFLCTFLFLTLGIALLIEYVTRLLAQEGYAQPMPYLGLLFLSITFLVALFYYATYKTSGGGYVAEALGAKRVLTSTSDFRESQLLNIVQEMALASGQPLPAVYVLPSKEINAFAAGMKSEDAAITVTRGALELLTRDELQGVIAHEFGHIYNADIKINMRLAAMLMGFFIVLYLGIRLIEGSFFFGGGRGNGRRGANPILVAALVFLLAGTITWIAGAILRSMVSREREYLADASAVQFTRNPEGITNALKKIAKIPKSGEMPRSGMAYAHLYFDNHSLWSTLFSTHPPLEKRIAALESYKYSSFVER